MKKLILIFTIIILGLGAQAQVNMDSLWGVWNDESQCDTCRLKAIYRIIWDGYRLSKPDSAFILAQLQYEFAEKTGEKIYMSKALNSQGVIAKNQGNFSKAIEYHNQSIVIAKEIDNQKVIALANINIGNVYNQQGNYKKAIEYYHQAIVIAKEIDNQKVIASANTSIGIIYTQQGNYKKALEYINQALKINKEIDNKKEFQRTTSILGGIYFFIKNYSKAIECFNQSLVLCEEINNKEGISIAHMNIGALYVERGDVYKGLSHIAIALNICEENNDKKGIGSCFFTMGNIYRELGDDTKALDYYMQSLKIFEEFNNNYRLSLVSSSIGDVYRRLNSEEEAIKWCKKALEISSDIGVIGEQKWACECLYLAYKSLGKGNEALEYHERMNILDDSLKKEETSKKLQQMEFAKQLLADSLLQVEEKLKVEHAHELEIQKKKRSRNIYIAIGIFILFLAIVLWSRLRYTRRAKGSIEKEKGRSDDLLLNILPAEIAEELKAKGEAKAAKFELVSILFTDFKGFTEISENLNSDELVSEINHCFKAFDAIIEKYKIEKIKTIGDAYMAAGGLPVPTADSVANTVKAALDMQAFITKRKLERTANSAFAFEMRAGIHSGSVVAGIVGDKKFQYDIWGDAVNIASRIESQGDIGKVNISQTTYDLIKDNSTFTFESRGKITTKGKGEIEMWFVGYADY